MWCRQVDSVAVGDFLWSSSLGNKNKVVGTAHAQIVPEPAPGMALAVGPSTLFTGPLRRGGLLEVGRLG